MPFTVLENDKDKKKKYLKNLFTTIYLKDIIEKNKLKKIGALDELCNILSSCSGQLLNSKVIADCYISIKKKK